MIVYYILKLRQENLTDSVKKRITKKICALVKNIFQSNITVSITFNDEPKVNDVNRWDIVITLNLDNEANYNKIINSKSIFKKYINEISENFVRLKIDS